MENHAQLPGGKSKRDLEYGVSVPGPSGYEYSVMGKYSHSTHIHDKALGIEAAVIECNSGTIPSIDYHEHELGSYRLYEQVFKDTEGDYYIILRENNNHAYLKFTLGTTLPTTGKMPLHLTHVSGMDSKYNFERIPTLHLYFKEQKVVSIQIGNVLVMPNVTSTRLVQDNVEARTKLFTEFQAIDQKVFTSSLEFVYDNLETKEESGIIDEFAIVEKALRDVLLNPKFKLTKESFIKIFTLINTPIIMHKLESSFVQNSPQLTLITEDYYEKEVITNLLFRLRMIVAKSSFNNQDEYDFDVMRDQTWLRPIEGFEISETRPGIVYRIEREEYDADTDDTIVYVQLSGNSTYDDLINLRDEYITSYVFLLNKLNQMTQGKVDLSVFDKEFEKQLWQLNEAYLKILSDNYAAATSLPSNMPFIGNKARILGLTAHMNHAEIDAQNSNLSHHQQETPLDLIDQTEMSRLVSEPISELSIHASIFNTKSGRKKYLGQLMHEICVKNRYDMDRTRLVLYSKPLNNINE
jgi:hypothetical protein